MATKADLVASCEAQNIFHRKGWSKKQLEEALEGGLKFGTLVEVKCARSGIGFSLPIEDVRPGLTHPGIRKYTQSNDPDLRGPATSVIDRQEWGSLEELEAAIELALEPEPPYEYTCKFEGAWVARITGAHPTYRFQRKFLDPVDWVDNASGRKFFDLQEDGIYECCYKSRKGNESRYHYRMTGGERQEITLEDIEALFPLTSKEAQPEVAGCQVAEKWLGEVGETVEHQGEDGPEVIVIVKVDSTYHWQDEDGISGTGAHNTDTDIMYDWYEHTTQYRPATPDEVAEHQARKNQHQERAAAVARLKEIAATIIDANNIESVSPDKADNQPFPLGPEFILRQGYYQANEMLVLETPEGESARLWHLTYNWRDGDCWDWNNVAGTHIGRYIEISAEAQAEIEGLLEVAARPEI